MSDADYPIQLVARITGLSPHVIRIWEQRYRAVEPARTSTNRRLYSQADIERLNLLREVTLGGHNIGQLARLPTDRLRALAAATPALRAPAAPAEAPSPGGNPWLEDSLAAVKALDAAAFDDLLKRAAAALGGQGVLQRLIAPLMKCLGEMWREGAITAAHEHFASGVVREHLARSGKSFAAAKGSPALVVATPLGQLHELGALLAGALAANLGWQVTQLGASLPAAEIAGAALQQRAGAVALSLVYPEDDPALGGELRTLRGSLPAEIPLIVGGRAMPAYREVLQPLGAVLVEDLTQLGAALDKLRCLPKPVTS